MVKQHTFLKVDVPVEKWLCNILYHNPYSLMLLVLLARTVFRNHHYDVLASKIDNTEIPKSNYS